MTLAKQTTTSTDDKQPFSGGAFISKEAARAFAADDIARDGGGRRFTEDKPRHKGSAQDELARIKEEQTKTAEANVAAAADEVAEKRAQKALDARSAASSLGWKMYPDEKPRNGQVVLAIRTDSRASAPMELMQYNDDGGKGAVAGVNTGTFYTNDAGAFSRFAGTVTYWQEAPKAPPAMPRGV